MYLSSQLNCYLILVLAKSYKSLQFRFYLFIKSYLISTYDKIHMNTFEVYNYLFNTHCILRFYGIGI